MGGSVFYSEEPKIPQSKSENEVANLEKELEGCKEGALLETKLTSTVWIVTTMQRASVVTVSFANPVIVVLQKFG